METTTSRKGKTMDQATIECPVSGELVPGEDVDALLAMYRRIKRVKDQMDDELRQLKAHLWNLTSSDNKTRYLVGEKLQAKLVEPSNTWDQSILRELHNSFPDLALRYMRIAELAVRKREVDQLRRSAGSKKLEGFKKILLAAERPPTSWPTVTVSNL
jgi:hypothetical protein